MKSIKRFARQQLAESPGLTRLYSRIMQSYRSHDVKAARGTLRLDPNRLDTTMQYNRQTLLKAGSWLDDTVLQASPSGHGIMDAHRKVIDLPLDPIPSLTDYLCYFAKDIPSLSYLEIGVSVGRNLWQVINSCSNASLHGFDLDNLYSVVRKQLISESVTEIPTLHKSVRVLPPQIEEFRHENTGNRLTMLSGDEFDRSLWPRFSGRKFNLIFSDAMHTADAVLYEWSMLRDLDLIDKSAFTMVWDDMVSRPMRQALDQIFGECVAKFGISPQQCCFMHVPGWFGRHEPPHAIGIVSSHGFVA